VNSSDKPSPLKADKLAIELDRGADMPLGAQLAWALRGAIAEAVLGQRLPGVRELAQALELNVNTVRSVYQRLALEGLIETRQGAGTFVAGRSEQSRAAVRIAAEAAAEATQSGADPREVAAHLLLGGQRVVARGGAAGQRRRELRLQIAGLERTVSALQVLYRTKLAAPAAPTLPVGPHLPSIAELEQTRTALVRMLVELQSSQDERGPARSDQSPEPARESSKQRSSAARPRVARAAPAAS
jgi:GntR family transcriptional regulator